MPIDVQQEARQEGHDCTAYGLKGVLEAQGGGLLVAREEMGQEADGQGIEQPETCTQDQTGGQNDRVAGHKSRQGAPDTDQEQTDANGPLGPYMLGYPPAEEDHDDHRDGGNSGQGFNLGQGTVRHGLLHGGQGGRDGICRGQHKGYGQEGVFERRSRFYGTALVSLILACFFITHCGSSPQSILR